MTLEAKQPPIDLVRKGEKQKEETIGYADKN